MTIVYLIHLFLCVFMVIVILLQPGKADAGVGFGGSSSQSIFGSKGAGNFLTKTTSVCAILFLFTSFYLTYDRIKANQGVKILDEETPAATTPAPSPSPDAKGAATPSPSPAAAPAKADDSKK